MTRRRKIYIAIFLLAVMVGLYAFWLTLLGPHLMLKAIAAEDANRITLIARSGINPNSDIFLVGGYLHCAAARGAVPSMAQLIALGADINRLDGYGMTPLMVSAKMNSPESYRWLVSRGADEAIFSRDGKTAREYLADLDKEGRTFFHNQ